MRLLTLATQAAGESDHTAPKTESDSAMSVRNRPGPSLSRPSDDQYQKRDARTKTALICPSSDRRRRAGAGQGFGAARRSGSDRESTEASSVV